MAVPVVCRFNKIKDLDVSSIVRKAMIKCGLNTDTDGLWKISQLKPQLRAILARHRKYFDGEPVSE